MAATTHGPKESWEIELGNAATVVEYRDRLDRAAILLACRGPGPFEDDETGPEDYAELVAGGYA